MSKIRILVVEDENLVARDIQNMLRSLGYEVTGVVDSGEQAIRNAAASVPDLVLMDIVLKGDIDGIAAAEELWENYGIPVIYLTAYADDATFERAKLTKPFGYLLKPFEERELQTTIEMALYKSKMETRLQDREQWLSIILRSIGDGIIAADIRGRIEFMNPLAERLTGWPQGEALEKPLEEVFEAGIAKPVWGDGAPIEGDTSGTANQASLEEVLSTRGGGTVPIELTSTPIVDGKKGTRGSVYVFRDITRRKESEDQLRRALKGVVQAMSATIEIRDPYTAGHQRRVSRLSVAIAREMGLPERQVEGIRMAGDIHDIGKIYVPAEILSKPGKLTDIEFTIIKTHPQVGYDILKNIEFPWPIADIVVQHHERLDGKGYPAGLKGDAILPEARIVIVADVVEAMSSHRPYRPAHGIEKALEEVSRNRDTVYDADVVDACLRLFKEKGFLLE